MLEQVEAADVRLRRRDGDDLVLTTAARFQARSDALRLLSETVVLALGDRRTLLPDALADVVVWTSSLTADERQQLLREVGRAAASTADLGATEPLERTLEKWRVAARERLRASELPSYRTRPVSIPDDVDDPSIEKASGLVELPLRVRWTPPFRHYDMTDQRQLRRVYEQVLREGTDEDVRHFIDVDTLVEHWDALILPPPVRRAWRDWLRSRRGLDVAL